MKFLIIITILLTGISIISISEVAAQNDDLFVSAKNTQFNNTFAGPMVIEVRINDEDLLPTNQTLSSPIVLIANKTLDMVQAQNGNWYGYFADRKMAEIADSTTSIDGKGLDFGGICTSKEARISIFNTPNSNFFKDVTGVATSDPSCGKDFDKNNINVLRDAKKVNDKLDNIGQANLASTSAWPFIQLFDFNQEVPIVVQYNKIENNKIKSQNVTLNFNVPSPEKINLILEGTAIYVPGSDVLLTVENLQLNIDPTDEDTWTWETVAPGGLFYGLFDNQGKLTTHYDSMALDILPSLSSLMFEKNQGLLLNPCDNDFPPVVNFTDNTFQKIPRGEDIVCLQSGDKPFPKGPQLITFRESQENSGIFQNFNENQNSNFVISSNAERGSAEWLEYNEKWHGILILDYSMKWNQTEYTRNDTATLIVDNPFMNKNPTSIDAIDVLVHSRNYTDGINLMVYETEKNSGNFTGEIKLNSCVKSSFPNELCVNEEDRIHANYNYTSPDDSIISNHAKSTISSFKGKCEEKEFNNFIIHCPKESDYYFAAIAQIEERLEAIDFSPSKYEIKFAPIPKDPENFFKLTQFISINIENRKEYDKIFTNPLNFTDNFNPIKGTHFNVTKTSLSFLCRDNNSTDCTVNADLKFNIDNAIGNHIFRESFFHNVTLNGSTHTGVYTSLKSNQTKPISIEEVQGDDASSNLKRIEYLPNSKIPIALIVGTDPAPNPDDKSCLPDCLFLNGFSYGFGSGKSFGYDFTPDGGDKLSADVSFAFGFGIGLRIPINVTVTPELSNNPNSASSVQNLSFTVNTANITEAEYETLGLPNYQHFEGQEFAVYLGPELEFKGGGEEGLFYEYEKGLPLPESYDFKPPLGDEGKEQFTDFDYSLSEILPALEIAKIAISADVYAGFNGYLEGNQITMNVTQSNNTAKPPIIFEQNNQTRTVSCPVSYSNFTIGDLIYNSTLNFTPKIGGEVYFLGFTIISKEIELGNIAFSNIPIGHHSGTNSSYPVNLISDDNTLNFQNVTVDENQVEFAIKGGNLTNTPYVNATSLIIGIDAWDDGQLIICLPRELIDAKIGVDDDFFVYVDDKEVDFNEISTSTDRTLTISFPAGAGEIVVVPEFGAIATIIFGVAITSIIAITFRSGIVNRF